MIIKIKDPCDGGWHLFDNVEDIHWGNFQDYKIRMYVRDRPGLIGFKYFEKKVGDDENTYNPLTPHKIIIDWYNFKPNQDSQKYKYLNWFSIKRGSIDKFIVFDSEGYILNDVGQTIEKINKIY